MVDLNGAVFQRNLRADEIMPAGGSPMLTITYAIDLDTSQVWSRVEGHPTAGNLKIAVPVLEYDKIGEGGDFTKPLTYKLEAMGTEALIHARLRWTRKIPIHTKNLHREFWGMKPLKPEGTHDHD